MADLELAINTAHPDFKLITAPFPATISNLEAGRNKMSDSDRFGAEFVLAQLHMIAGFTEDVNKGGDLSSQMENTYLPKVLIASISSGTGKNQLKETLDNLGLTSLSNIGGDLPPGFGKDTQGKEYQVLQKLSLDYSQAVDQPAAVKAVNQAMLKLMKLASGRNPEAFLEQQDLLEGVGLTYGQAETTLMQVVLDNHPDLVTSALGRSYVSALEILVALKAQVLPADKLISFCGNIGLDGMAQSITDGSPNPLLMVPLVNTIDVTFPFVPPTSST